MMKTEKTLVNVDKGQDAYSVIGNYISNHITAIEDMIAVIQIDGCITNELYLVDMEADGYFYWESDWWEGEEDVALIDFFPVSEAERPQEWVPCNPSELPKDKKLWVTHDRLGCRYVDEVYWDMTEWSDNVSDVVAYMPYVEPEPYKAESEEV